MANDPTNPTPGAPMTNGAAPHGLAASAPTAQPGGPAPKAAGPDAATAAPKPPAKESAPAVAKPAPAADAKSAPKAEPKGEPKADAKAAPKPAAKAPKAAAPSAPKPTEKSEKSAVTPAKDAGPEPATAPARATSAKPQPKPTAKSALSAGPSGQKKHTSEPAKAALAAPAAQAKPAAPTAAKPSAPTAKPPAPTPKPAAPPVQAAPAAQAKPAAPAAPRPTAAPATAPATLNAPVPTDAGYALPDPAEFSKNMIRIATKSQHIISDFIRRQSEQGGTHQHDPLNVTSAFMNLLGRMLTDPSRIIDAQVNLWKAHLNLWQNATRRFFGETLGPVIEPSRADKRFKHPDWQENQIFDYIKQSYLLTARWMQETVGEVEGLEPEDRKKVDFYTRQFADMMSPSNFVVTNPEVLRTTLASNGENLVKGLENLIADMERGQGQLSIKQTDLEHFEVGVNIATTPGKVVYQNAIMQIIQYTPTTAEVYKTPIIIFPPWINKFYILDLRPENSLIKWLVDQGHTVFVASWVNPGPELAVKTFEDYMHEGIFEGIGAAQKATGEEKINVVGYCIGGTLLGATLAYMAEKKIDTINSATFFTAQLDFSEAGELAIFIDDEQLDALEHRMNAADGVLEGTAMATTFNMLRANDLIWSYVVNNYLLGKEPFRFDLLYWNSDSTRMPKALHLYYLREFYKNNAFTRGDLLFGGIHLDPNKIKVPAYFQSGKEDHIAPHPSVFKGMKLVASEEKRFIVGGSGHIAGVVNPPSAQKYSHWTNDKPADTIEEWWAGATEHPGSWWPDWDKWLAKRSGPKVKARVPGDRALKVIEDAPGSYVKVRADDGSKD